MMNPSEFANIAEAERDFWWYRGMRDILFAVLDPLVAAQNIRTVLEAGCGTGYNASALERRYGWRAYPLDLQMEGLEYAKALGVTRLTQGDVAALPFGAGAFDAVFSLDVIVHFPRGDEDRALAELTRVLAPGGLLVLRVAALDVLRSRHSQFTCERQRFTAKRLKAQAAHYGIRVQRCTYANTFLLPAALARFRVWEPLMRRPPQSGVRPVGGWLNRLMTLPLAAESR
ncbi:MAG: class I SAM-dependent methyltransferase, partial [Bryobacteraceae bacterium]